MGVLDNFFPTGTYTGIGTSVLSLKNVLKSTTKKKSLADTTYTHSIVSRSQNLKVLKECDKLIKDLN